MAGRRDARDQRHAERMELAWTFAALRLQGRKLQRLESLLAPPRPKKAETPDELLAALQSLAAQPGVDMTIKLVKTRAQMDAEEAAAKAASV